MNDGRKKRPSQANNTGIDKKVIAIVAVGIIMSMYIQAVNAYVINYLGDRK
jgi:hypothetical protein